MASHGHPMYHYIITQGWSNPGPYVQEFTVDDDVSAENANYMTFATGMKDVDNDEKYGLLYTKSCDTFRYDFGDVEYEERLGEEYLADGDGGGVAYIGNTGPGLFRESNFVAEKFLQKLMNQSVSPDDDIFVLGLAHVLARAEYCGGEPNHPAYTCNVGGDPTMTVWTAEPEDLTMTYDSWSEDGGYTLEVELSEEGSAPVEEVEVILWVPETYYLLNWTNEDGKARFKVPDTFSGGMLTAWKHNYIPALANNVSVGGE